MDIAELSEGVTLICADCRDVLPTLGQVDAVVTDPPYGLRFMGKAWDYDVPDVDLWRLVLAVCKPGAHLLSFAGTRTQHRMAVNIEDAGWEIRDMIAWVYGSGFPKSVDVSKAIDKRGGNVAGFAEFRDAVKAAMQRNGISRQQLEDALGNFMLSHYLTAGSQPAVPVLRDYRIIRDTVGLGNEFDELFNDEAEREVVGQNANIKRAARSLGGEIGFGAGSLNADITAPATEAAKQWAGYGTALKPSCEPITMARKPLAGTVAENVLQYGTGGINVDGCRVGTEKMGGYVCGQSEKQMFSPSHQRAQGYRPEWDRENKPYVAKEAIGRWPANLIHDGSDEVVGLFPETTSGGGDKHGRKASTFCASTDWEAFKGTSNGGDSGSAARFFYCAKASKADRGVGNDHPTVKPIRLMQYLITLGLPPGGVLLDPFAGSGTTGRAAKNLGRKAVLIEREEHYCEIAARRMAQKVLPHSLNP